MEIKEKEGRVAIADSGHADATAQKGERTLSELEVAEFLGVAPRTIRHFRAQATNPLPFLRVGIQARYLRSAVIAWAEKNSKELQRRVGEKARHAQKRSQKVSRGAKKFR